MPREFVKCDLFQPIGPYSHAVKSGNMIFVSGTPGVDPKSGELAGTTAYAQAAQAIRNVIDCIVAAGGSEADITTVQVNLVHVDDFTGACTEFCVNGHLAGNCYLVWRHNELEETRRT